MYNTINTTYTYLPCQILAHMDAVEPWSPPANFYRLTPGLWVRFTGPIDNRQLKHHGYITKVDGGLITVVDKHTFAEVSNKLSSAELANIRSKFNIDRAELEVAVSQGPSLPAGDWVHHGSMGHNHVRASQKLQRCCPRNQKHFSYCRAPSSLHLFCLTVPSIPITLFQTNVCALSIGQCVTDLFSLG